MGEQNNRPIVLKMVRDNEAFENESHALRSYQGHGGVALLDHDKAYNALLLQRLVPGQNLKALFPQEDDHALNVTSVLVKSLHGISSPVKKDFPSLEDWLTGLENPMLFSSTRVLKAKVLVRDLLQTNTDRVLLHGDLHHENILFDKVQGWTAIDPKGVIGDPAYEVGAFIRNPFPDVLSVSDPGALIQRRIEIFANFLGVSSERIIKWCYVQAILSACWMQEDQLDPHPALELADVIQSSCLS